MDKSISTVNVISRLVPLLKKKNKTCWQRKRARPKKRKRKKNRKASPRRSLMQKRNSRRPDRVWVRLPEVACEGSNQRKVAELSTNCVLFGAVAGVSSVVGARRGYLRDQGRQDLYVGRARD